ncbi:Ribonuclease HI [compost metagenome]
MSTESTTPTNVGMVAYADGSFRRGLAGWGVHAYVYTAGALEHAKGEKQLPTPTGYKEVPLAESSAVVAYVDAYATVPARKVTNNVAELQAVIETFSIAKDADVQKLLVYTDSQYVQANLFKTVPKWIKNDWIKADGSPVANREYWEQLITVKDDWLAAGRNLEIEWIKGHNGHRGNECADGNALLGSAYRTEKVSVTYTEIQQANKIDAPNPLLQRTRLLFDVSGSMPLDAGNYYCMYSLGRAHSYGHKQTDSTLEKIAKTDLILGRRLAEAVFCILKTPERDPYLEELMDNHRKDHPSQYSQPAVIRLDNVLTPNMRKRYMEMGNAGFAKLKNIQATVAPDDTLISKTLSPPKQAYEAVKLFGVLKQQLDDYCSGNVGKGVQVIDITDSLFFIHQEGKKKPVNKLHATITNNTPYIEVPAVINGVEIKLKLVLGLDIPVRNTLARIAESEPKVSVLVVANGPLCYSFTTVVDSSEGVLIYTCPYTQFILKK